MNETLILNADAQPISFLPVSYLSWQEAVKFMCVGAAEPLHLYEDWEVHSPSITIQVPSVIILKEQVHSVRKWIAREAGGPQKSLVFLRDLYVCQYCNEQFSRNQLTIDHVIPRYHGGRTKWDNITTACERCNCKRGHNVKIQPAVAPFRPTYGQLIKNMRKFPISLGHSAQNYYLGWDEDKVRIVDPRRTTNQNFGFYQEEG